MRGWSAGLRSAAADWGGFRRARSRPPRSVWQGARGAGTDGRGNVVPWRGTLAAGGAAEGKSTSALRGCVVDTKIAGGPPVGSSAVLGCWGLLLRPGLRHLCLVRPTGVTSEGVRRCVSGGVW